MGMFVFIVLLIALWQGMYWFGVEIFAVFKSYSVPSPMGVGECFIRLVSDGSLLQAAGYSLLRGIAGYVAAVLIGTLLGLLMNHFTYLQKNLKPVVLGIQTLPSVCWVPFSILWFGLSTEAISVDNAIRNVPLIYKKAALTMGAQKQQMYRYVIFPACLPELISGLKQGWSFAWRALMAGEVMTTSIGLGQTLIMGRDLADINQVMLVMIVIILIGMLIDKCVFSVIEKQVMRKRE